MNVFIPPEGCGFCTEDLECLGCGRKLRLLKPGECGAEEDAKRRAEELKQKELQQLAYLKKKYDT